MNLLATLKRLIGAIVISFIATSPSANAAASVVVPGCAPIHPPTCVQWKKPKGEGWSVQNKCGAAVSVTLEKRSSTPILSPGQVWPVEIKPAQYLVFDSGEYDKWIKNIPKRSWGQFHDEVGFPCEDKLLVAQQSGGENSNVGQTPSGSATTSSEPTSKKSSLDIGATCGRSVSYSATDEVKYPPMTTTFSNSWELISEDPIRIRFTLNGKESSQGNVNDYISESERGLRQDQENRLCQEIRFCREDKPGLEKTLQWLKCVAESGTAASTSKSASTKGQVSVGNASEVNGRKEGEKSAWKRGDSQTSQSQSQQESDAGAQGSNDSPKSKYVSKDATHCVEIIPKGFKGCTYKRCLHNTCGLEKISVWARGGGSTGDGLFFLSPGQNYPVNSIFDDGSPVRYQACSWDRKADSGGPYRNPCRY